MTIARQYDEVIDSDRMRALYGESGYFNVGLWEPGTASLVDACDRLVDELADEIPADARLIVDVGCGLGAGTLRLANRFPDALVVGVNISPWQLGHARGRGVQAVAVMDAARLALADGCADAVVALESPQHFDTRADFLQEAHRVLRPGGTIAVADMLFHDRGPVGEWMLPAANAAIDSPGAYEAALLAAGFRSPRVRDITAESWTPYCREMERVFSGHQDVLEAIERSLAYYVVAVAQRT